MAAASRGPRSACSALLVAILSACAAPRAAPELGLPDARIELTAWAGDPVSGVLPVAEAGIDPDPAHALVLSLELDYLERWPGELGRRVDPGARLVVETRSGDLFRPSAALAGLVHRLSEADAAALDARVAKGELGRVRRLSDWCGPLPAGVTRSLVLAESDEDSEDAVPRELGVSLARGTDPGSDRASLLLVLAGRALEVPHALEDLVPGEDGSTPAPRPRPVDRREFLPLGEAVASASEPWVLLVRSPFDGPGQALVLRIALSGAPSEASALAAHGAALEDLQAELVRAEEEARASSRTLGTREARARELERALLAIQRAPNRRAALFFAAGATNAALAADLALAASEDRLDLYLAALAAERDPAELAQDGEVLGWALERGAWTWLASLMDEDGLPPDLAGLAVRHGGEVARSGDAIADVLAVSSGLADLARNLVEENRIGLEDEHPAARVRACDWLAARDLAPAGFDPLASREERRAALAALEELEDAVR